jgi:hypothetical protein
VSESADTALSPSSETRALFENKVFKWRCYSRIRSRLSESDFSAPIPGPPLPSLRNQRFLFRRTLMDTRMKISWSIRRLATRSRRNSASYQEAFRAGDCPSGYDLVLARCQRIDGMRWRGDYGFQQLDRVHFVPKSCFHGGQRNEVGGAPFQFIQLLEVAFSALAMPNPWSFPIIV